MTAHRAIADEVRVHFTDGTSTVIHVLDDEEIQDAIIDLCEREGWGLDELTDYQITGQVYANGLGSDGV